MMLAYKSDSGIALFPSQSGNPFPMPPNRHTVTPHIAFNVDREDFSEIQKDLNNKGIAFVFQDHTTYHSIYLRDPDDYCIELTTFIT